MIRGGYNAGIYINIKKVIIMRTRTAQWFECKIKYEKVMEDGLQKQVVEQYVVDALSFAEAEARITQFMSQYISGSFEVADVKKASYKEVFFSDNADDDRFYKAKLQFITIDEKTEKEKRSNVTYLVQACSLHNALDNIDTVMKGTMIDYVQANVGETQLIDVFEYQADEKKRFSDLIAKMAEDLKDKSLNVEDIVDRYTKSATPELRQDLIEKLTEIRKNKFGIEG